MRTLPHRPDLSRLPAIRDRLSAAIEGLSKAPEPTPADEALRAEQQTLLGLVAYVEEAPLGGVRALLKEGVTTFVSALEKGHAPGVWELRHFASVAASIGDRSSLQFIASIPEPLWVNERNGALYVSMIRLKAWFALLRHEEPESTRWVQASQAMAFEERLPSALKEESEEIQNFHGLLQALHEKDAGKFQAELQRRISLRALSLARNGGHSPLGYVDLDGLALCSLARDRDMPVTVRHEYLPLDLAEGPAS